MEGVAAPPCIKTRSPLLIISTADEAVIFCIINSVFHSQITAIACLVTNKTLTISTIEE